MSLMRDDREPPEENGDEPVFQKEGKDVRITEARCKSALSKSKLTGLEYALNPYKGCEHGCLYCYSPAVIHYEGKEPWGSFVEARVNMPVQLSHELRKQPMATVGVGTVTDPYQQPESWFRITRHCLEQLVLKQWPVCIHTKSKTVVDDIELLKQFKDIEVGFTFTTADDKERAAVEPRASSTRERLDALGKLKDAGIPTFVYFGPVLPGIITEGIEGLFKELKDLSIKRFSVDRLRMHKGVWESLRPFIEKKHPELVDEYRMILYGQSESYEHILLELADTARHQGLSVTLVEEP